MRNPQPPVPICKCFVFCRQVFHDRQTGEYLLLGPLAVVQALSFPAIIEVSFFARCSSAQGAYQLELQLQDLEGNVVWGVKLANPLECADPLAIGSLDLGRHRVVFPRPGKFEFVFLANGQEVIRDVLLVGVPKPKRA